MWTLKSSLVLVRHLEKKLAPHYHVALAGGVLLTGESKHDLDIIVYPHRTDHFNINEIHGLLKSCKLEIRVTNDRVKKWWKERLGSNDGKHVDVWTCGDLRIDVIILK